MIPKECKRLAEVDFPIAAVSKHSAREKSIRHGHPSTLHLWWARRPLAACRSMLMALLLPDPCDPHCPEEFKRKARQILLEFPGRPTRWENDLNPKHGTKADEAMRHAILHEFIADFANWDNAAKPAYLNTARALVKAAHGEEPPLVVDPFAGGGSIPLEALRIGCDAFASDLNPVACLILKVLLEDIPRHGPALAEELRRVGAEIKKQAEKELAEFYPPDPDGARPIAYLWARTIRCESPECGAEIPIFKSAWLSKRGAKRAKYFKEDPKGRCVALLMDAPKGGPVRLRIARGEGSENARHGFEVLVSTKAPGNNSNVLCPCCNRLVQGNRVMIQLGAQAGGSQIAFDQDGRRVGGAYLLSIITAGGARNGRQFRLPGDRDFAALLKANRLFARNTLPRPVGELNPTRPSPNARGVTAPTRYGVKNFTDLFTARQCVAIATIAAEINKRLANAQDSNSVLLGAILALGRCIDQTSAQVRWISNIEAIASSFPRQALQMTWDFAESVPHGDESANYGAAIEWVAKVIDMQGRAVSRTAQTSQSDARRCSLPDESVDIYFTDPPYYDAVPYADLADFFLSWLKPLFIGSAFERYRFDDTGGLSPKQAECVWNRAHVINGEPKSPAFFEGCVGSAFGDGRRMLKDDAIGCVVFAHKTTEGWESLLSGLLSSCFVIRASWPIMTERSVRTNAQNTASLASSVHLICRPRDDGAGVGDWGETIRELPPRVADWMERLQDEGIRGADLVFACIGPALEIFSRYSKVETAEGREIPLAEYLEKVWEVVGRSALQQILGTAEGRARNGAAGALEEDARLTALFLWTMQSTEAQNGAANGGAEGEDDEAEEDEEEARSKSKKTGFSLIYDVARRFAQPLGIHLEAWEDRIIETDKGVVRLLPVLERAEQLFGEEGASAVADRLERGSGTAAAQLELFPQSETEAPRVRARGRGRSGSNVSDESLRTRREATTLDRVHAAMLLQSGGRANALRALLKAEVDRGPDFLRLANALSALYPQGSDEKRLLDAMLLAVPR